MKKSIKQNNTGAIVDNNNKQLFARLYGVAIVLILSVLSLSVQAQAIPTIVYSLTPPPLSPDITTDSPGAYSIREGGTAEGTTATFILTRESGYTTPTNVIVSITRTSDSNDPADPDNFVVTVDGNPLTLTNDDDQSSVMITFATEEDAKTISFSFTGNDALNDDYVYSIRIAPANVPPGDDEEIITFTIRDDEDDIPPTLPGNQNIEAIPGATQVTLNFESAYDRVGSIDDLSNATFTRDVDYVITITRLASDDKPMLTLPSITMTATELGLDFAEGNSRPSAEPIEILLTRDGVFVGDSTTSITLAMSDDDSVVLTPGDAYMVEISVRDRANRFSSQTYEGDFTMLRNGASDELAALNIDCSTGDNDGIASAYELSIGTDCNSDVDDYIGPNDPANAPIDATTITFALQDQPGQSTPIAAAGASRASRYTQIDTGVTCEGTACNNLKAFIVSSGLIEDNPTDDTDGADADAVAMVTDRCPLPLDITANPRECWVDEVIVNKDGNMEIPLQLGYSVIDWVAADDNGNLILSTSQKQLVYVAPVVILSGGITDLVLPAVSPDITASFRVRFTQGIQNGNSIRFIGSVTRTIPDNVRPTITFSCDSAISVASPPVEGRYTYTATDAGTCSFPGLTGTSPVPFADPSSLDPLFYFAGNGINVVRADDTNRVADVRIGGIEVTESASTGTIIAAVTPTGSYDYTVVNPSGSDVIVEITLMEDGLESEVPGDRNPDGTGDFSLSDASEEGYISIKATIEIAEGEITHTVVYPILPAGTAPLSDREDNDGVPDSRSSGGVGDSDDFNEILLSSRTDTIVFQTIKVLFGRVTLGNIARRDSHGQARLGLERNDPLIPDGNGLPVNYNDEGVFEFDVYLPANTNTAFISIPLAKVLNENKGYVKYTTDGGWIPFISTDNPSTPEPDDGDAYYSAPGIPVIGSDLFTCPFPVNPFSGITQWGKWKNELVKGHGCILLVIRDNQPDDIVNNDIDEQLNGIIVNPGAPGGFPIGTTRGPRGGGGGATDLWFLLMLLGLIAVPVLTRHRKRLTR